MEFSDPFAMAVYMPTKLRRTKDQAWTLTLLAATLTRLLRVLFQYKCDSTCRSVREQPLPTQGFAKPLQNGGSHRWFPRLVSRIVWKRRAGKRVGGKWSTSRQFVLSYIPRTNYCPNTDHGFSKEITIALSANTTLSLASGSLLLWLLKRCRLILSMT